MKHMTRSYPAADAMLRPHKESTLEKNQKERMKSKPQELDDSTLLNKKANQRLKRKEALADAMNKLHDADIA
jgi:hypothetical protein